ncbi:hypothetical protein Bca4012_038879 [Brassica carinata]
MLDSVLYFGRQFGKDLAAVIVRSLHGRTSLLWEVPPFRTRKIPPSYTPTPERRPSPTPSPNLPPSYTPTQELSPPYNPTSEFPPSYTPNPELPPSYMPTPELPAPSPAPY